MQSLPSALKVTVLTQAAEQGLKTEDKLRTTTLNQIEHILFPLDTHANAGFSTIKM